MKKTVKPLKELLAGAHLEGGLQLRDIEGFPIGKDEDILALSDPPYYTACPNPYINDFIEEHGKPYDEATDDYHREPFVGDVSEGKNDPIYNAHSYHTKVPHKAIMKYIEHYTKEGDIVFDGFCGTGMTGVAAQLLNRKAILSDLSPIATFIAYNYNKKVDVTEFEREANRILREVEEEFGWMYETNHVQDGVHLRGGLHLPHSQSELFSDKKSVAHLQGGLHFTKGKINYTVWSDVFICPYCGEEIVFWEVAVDKEEGSVKKEFPCPHCQATMTKRDCRRATVTFFDSAIGLEVTQARQVPVLINYTYNGKRYEKTPDADDLALIKKIEKSEIPYWFPTDKIQKGDKTGEPLRIGITHVHHFYTKRTVWILSTIYHKFNEIRDQLVRKTILFTFTASITGLSKLQRYRHKSTFPNMVLSGTLYIGSQIREWNVVNWVNGKLKSINKRFLPRLNDKVNMINCSIFTNSIEKTYIKADSIDYVFTDPPFGDNLMYSELSFVWEGWLKVKTNNKSEAIINKSQNKALPEYYDLMLKSFKEYYRVLKPDRWITVEFHNSKSSVWNAIQEAMSKAGFIIANVAILDKKQGSFNQVTATGSVKNDLVISAYKPKESFERKFLEQTGEGLEEEFIRMLLSHLPPEPSIERSEQMLYSKLLAYYVQRGYAVKYDAKTFYKMLHTHFAEEDGYWFNGDQLPAYREYKKKLKLDGLDVKQGQLSLFVSDEKSALQWLWAFLDQPKDFKTIHPAFTKVANISGDRVPDLRELLEDNFIQEEGGVHLKGGLHLVKYRRPKTEEEKTGILQKREKELLREFESLLLQAKASSKKIKECRKQAVLFGFEHCYKAGRFQDILALAKRLDKRIIENDAEINDFIEVAELKVEGF